MSGSVGEVITNCWVNLQVYLDRLQATMDAILAELQAQGKKLK